MERIRGRPETKDREDRSGTCAGLLRSSAQKIQNITPHLLGEFFGANRASYGGSLLIGIEEVDTVGADAEMSLEIPLYPRTELVVQVSEYEVGYLLAGFVSQYRCRFTCCHLDRSSRCGMAQMDCQFPTKKQASAMEPGLDC